MADAAALVAEMRAGMDKFGDDMKRADDIADRAIKSIENRFAQSNPSAAGMLDNLRKSAESEASNAGEVIGGILGASIVAGAIYGIKSIKDLIEALSNAGDRADDLRLPINLLQALSVAAGEARVSAKDLNGAMDHLADISKKDEDELKKFNKALSNVDEKFVDLFKNAPTQAERVRLIADALKAATTEVQRVQVAQQALGSDNERLIGIFAGGREAINGYLERLKALGLEVDEAAVKKAQEAKSALSLLSRVMTDELSSSLASLIPTFRTWIPLIEQVGAAIRDTLAAFSEAERRPLATLDNEIADVQRQFDELIKLQTAIKSGRSDQDTSLWGIIGELMRQLPGFTEVEGKNIDKAIAELQGRITELLEARAKVAGLLPTAPKEPARFQPRPPLNAGDDSQGKNAFDRQEDSIRRHIAAQHADAEAVGLGTAAQAQFRAEAALTEALLRDGIEINDEYAERMDKIAAASADAAQKLEQTKDKLKQINDGSRELGSALADAFKGATLEGKKLTEVMNSLLNRLASKSIDKLFDLFFAPQSGNSTSAFSGLIGSLFPKNAEGTDNWRGGPTWVGERGPELVNLPKGAQIIPNQVARSVGGGNQTNITMHVAGEVSQDTVNRLERMILRTGKALSETNRALVSAQRFQRSGVY